MISFFRWALTRGDSRKTRSRRSVSIASAMLVDHLAPAAQVARALRQLEERLGVVPRDRGFAHY